MSRKEINALQTLTLAVTGASGTVLALKMLRALASDARVGRIHLVVSPSALRVLAEETGFSGRNSLVEKVFSDSGADAAEKAAGADKIVQHAHEDVGAPIASGSYPSRRNDRASLLHGDAGWNRPRTRWKSCGTRCGCLPKGAAAAGAVRPGDPA